MIATLSDNLSAENEARPSKVHWVKRGHHRAKTTGISLKCVLDIYWKFVRTV